MIPENYKNSLVIPQQLPAFIRNESDYQTFISFLQAYYDFLALEGNVEERGKNLLNFNDLDKTISEFEGYFFNEFLQNFPKDSFVDKLELVKYSRELYQRKSTPASFRFLMRSLYDSYCQTINTKDYVLIASDGKWNISTYLRVDSLDTNFLSLKFNKIIGELSKATAKIERTQVLGDKTEIFVSDIHGSFISGEYIRVVDDILNDKLFSGEVLRAKIVGSVKRVIIDPAYRGLNYEVSDPVLITGGISSEITNPVYATAEVESVTLGSLKSIALIDGSSGYRLYPNSVIRITGGGGSGAEAIISAVDNTNPALVSFLPIDIISPYANTVLDATYPFTVTANANTRLIDAFSFANFETYPISEITLTNPGTRYTTSPTVTAETFVDYPNTTITLDTFGILSPLRITYSGYNYANDDVIVISGGSGVGAYANVKSVGANGEILQVQYIYDTNNLYPLGGIGYKNDSLPSVSVTSIPNKIISLTANNSSNISSNTLYFPATDNVRVGMFISGNGISNTTTFGYFTTNTQITKVESDKIFLSTNLTSNVNSGDVYTIDGTALLSVPSILGSSAAFASTTDSIGAIQSIKLLTSGEQYSFVPDVSLKVLDLIVYDINELYYPTNGDYLYQGDAESSTFTGYFYSLELVDPNPAKRLYRLRMYNYDGSLTVGDKLYIDKDGVNSKTLSFTIDTSFNSSPFVNGVKYYGNGAARATAELIEGTVNLKGGYVNSDGFLSDANYLQSDVFNFYSYFLFTEKSFADFKNSVYDILHPAGKHLVPYNTVNESANDDISASPDVARLESFEDVFSAPDAYVVLEEPNKLQFYNAPVLSITDDYFRIGTYIRLTSTNGEEFASEITIVDSANDVIYLEDYSFIELPNVAYGYAQSNSIIVTSLTGSYDLINNGEYSNTSNYFRDIVFVNDQILISNNTYLTVDIIDYENRIIYANAEFSSSGNASAPNLITIKRNFACNANNILITPSRFNGLDIQTFAFDESISLDMSITGITDNAEQTDYAYLSGLKQTSDTADSSDVISINPRKINIDEIYSDESLQFSESKVLTVETATVSDNAGKNLSLLAYNYAYQDYANGSYFAWVSSGTDDYSTVYNNSIGYSHRITMTDSIRIYLNGNTTPIYQN